MEIRQWPDLGGGLTLGMQRGDVNNFEHLGLARPLDGVMSCVAFVDKGGISIRLFPR